MSAFHPYPTQINPMLAQVKQQRPVALEQSFKGKTQSNDKILYLMEQARLAQIYEEWDLSRQSFAGAVQAIQEQDRKAVLSASGAGAQASAIMVNDNVIPYRPAGYERVFLHHYQALNYLAANDLNGAGVEVRCANYEQGEALKLYQAEVARREKEEDKNQAEVASAEDSIQRRFAGLDEVGGKVKNSFQNAYTFYVSGIIYELLGFPNDAYIDYKKALEIFPENIHLQRDVLRLAKKLSMGDDLADYKKRFPEAWAKLASQTAGASQLVILFEEDFVPAKQEISIPIPISASDSIVPIAFPIYDVHWSEPRPLTVTAGGVDLGASAPICYVSALAVKALQEKLPGLLTRQVARAIAKGVTAKVANDQMGSWGSVLASVYNIVTESADLRSWLSLPGNAQILRAWLKPGEYELRFRHAGYLDLAPLKVTLVENGITVVWMFSVDNAVYKHVFALQ